MANVAFAIIVNGIVINKIAFDSVESGESFNFDNLGIEGAIGVYVPDDIFVDMGYSYADGKFAAPPPPEPTRDDYIREAENKRYYLLDEANNFFNSWQTRLLISLASDDEKDALSAAEKKTLTEWVSYMETLKEIDVSKAPDINWPSTPKS